MIEATRAGVAMLSCKKSLSLGRSDDGAIVIFGCIDMDTVLIDNESFRDDVEPLRDFYRKLLITIGKF